MQGMRFLCFISIVIVSAILPWWLVLPLWACYAFAFQAYELILLGVLLDAYFGYTMPWHILYTLTAAALCFLIELLRPRMAFYVLS